MKRIIYIFILSLFIGLLLPLSVNAQDEQLVIIGNAASVPSEIGMNQLKSVLKGEKLRWNDGSKVSIALMKTSTPIGTYTCNKLYNMTGNELNKYFLALVFQGKVKAPTFFNSANELEAFVARTPGAIGVLQQVNDKLLKIILVDGKKQI
jgi:hypothetical protein